MIDMAYARSFVDSVGLPLEKVQSNVDDDPVFKAALRRFMALNEARRPSTPATKVSAGRSKPWWKFWRSPR